MAAAFGIRFGATTASLAVFKDGKTAVVANENGDRATPAIVAFTDHDQTVGLAAKQGLVRNANNTVCGVKSLIGKNYDDMELQEIKERSAVKIIEKDSKPMYEVSYKEKTCQFSAQSIAAVIFKNLLEIAERHGEGKESHDAVLTVPLHFTEQQQKELRAAAADAGFNVLRIIKEPIAAMLAYDIGQTDQTETSNVLIYRLGGSTMDVTLGEVKCGMYRVLTSAYSDQSAGTEITKSLVKYFASEFKRQWKSDPLENKRATAKLTAASEMAKHILSNINTTTCSVESLHEGVDFQCSLSRSRMEGMVSSLVSGCLKPIEEVLDKAGLSQEDIHKVVLSGGGCRMPLVKSQLQKLFPSAELLSHIQPDEVVAVGAAIEAGILLGTGEEEREMNAQDNNIPSLSCDILIQCQEGDVVKNVKIVSKHTPIPARQNRSFQMGAEQTSFTLSVFYMDGMAEPMRLGKLVMKDLPAASKINGAFHLKSDGALHITCSEPTSSSTQHLNIETS